MRITHLNKQGGRDLVTVELASGKTVAVWWEKDSIGPDDEAAIKAKVRVKLLAEMVAVIIPMIPTPMRQQVQALLAELRLEL